MFLTVASINNYVNYDKGESIKDMYIVIMRDHILEKWKFDFFVSTVLFSVQTTFLFFFFYLFIKDLFAGDSTLQVLKPNSLLKVIVNPTGNTIQKLIKTNINI